MLKTFRSFGFSILFAIATAYALPVSGQSHDEPMSPEYLQEKNILYFLVACNGPPVSIPLTDSSPYLLKSDGYPNPPYFQQVVWLEPNCSFLFTFIDDPASEVLPYKDGFISSAVTLGLVSVLSNRRKTLGRPHSLSDILTESQVQRDRVYYYTDLDLSGTFDPSERLQSEGTKAANIVALYSDEDIKREMFAEPFMYLANYDSSQMIFAKIAEYVRGPLSPRGLYVVAIITKKE